MEGDQGEYVWLQDGRRIAYQEMGCKEDNAAHSLLVLHGAFSSRLFAMPGVSEAVLQDFGVRLVSIDRPGYGESDPHPSQTLLAFTRDMETVMDQLHMGATVWLLGYSLGAMYCWAAARYIPHRLAGIALWSPAANFEWKLFTPQENEAIKAGFSWKALRALYFLSKSLSFSLFRRHVGDLCRQLVEKSHNLEAFQKDLPEPDKKALERPDVLDFVLRDRLRSVGGWTNGFGLAKDFQLLTTCWGFELNDIGNVYQGQIHIWQGDVDSAVPLLLQKIIKKELPLVVKLHELHGEGHFSWYYFNNSAHYSTLSTLFKRTSEQRSRI